MLSHILFFGWEVHDNPYIYPAVRCLVCIELGIIDWEHKNNIVILKIFTSDIFKIVATTVKVIVGEEIARVSQKLANDLPSFPSPMIELLCSWCIMPQSVEFLLGLFSDWTQFRFIIFRAVIQVCKWPCEKARQLFLHIGWTTELTPVILLI